MSWLLIAAIPPALWGITNLIEDFFVDRYIGKKSIGLVLIFSALPSIVFLPVIYLWKTSVASLPIAEGFLIILNGVLSCLALVPYYLALRYSQASNVVPIFQSIPVFGFILGFLLLGESVSGIQLLGSLLIIVGGLGISFQSDGGRLKFDRKTFSLMLLSSFLIALSSLIFKFFAINNDFLTVVFWDLLGSLILGLIFFFFFDSFRRQFLGIFKNSKKTVILLSFSNESLGLAAEVGMNLAVTLVPIGLAWSMNGLQPFLVLIYSCILSIIFPKIFRESMRFSDLAVKLIFICMTVVGVFLIFR